MNSTWPPVLLTLLEKHQNTLGDRAPMAQRVAQVLEILGPLPYAIVKVTGTNGKGSVCAMLSAILAGRGLKVGSFTSPHLINVRERFRINGTPVAEDLLEERASHYSKILDQLDPTMAPTFFELLMLLGLDLFRILGADVVVLEAGIGGYRDATHFLDAAVSAITSVALDHAEQLGPTLSSVASDKAGICCDGGWLVLSSSLAEEAQAAIVKETKPRLVRTVLSDPTRIRAKNLGLDGFELYVDHCGPYRLPLAGPHQLANLATVLSILDLLQTQGQIPNQSSLNGLASVNWPGRMQQVQGPLTWLLDVGHNPEALTALGEALAGSEWAFEDRVLVYGVAQEKDLQACTALLGRLAPKILIVDGFYRATASQEIVLGLSPDLQVLGCFDVAALDQLIHRLGSDPKKRVLVTGSVFLVGAILSYLGTLPDYPRVQI